MRKENTKALLAMWLPWSILVGGCVDETVGPASTPAPEPECPTEMRILTPNGGESFGVGDTMLIRTRTDDLQRVMSIYLDISTDGGISWYDVGTIDLTNELDTFAFHIPDSMVSFAGPTGMTRVPTVSDKCLIRGMNYEETVVDKSDGVFSIH